MCSHPTSAKQSRLCRVLTSTTIQCNPGFTLASDFNNIHRNTGFTLALYVILCLSWSATIRPFAERKTILLTRGDGNERETQKLVKPKSKRNAWVLWCKPCSAVPKTYKSRLVCFLCLASSNGHNFLNGNSGTQQSIILQDLAATYSHSLGIRSFHHQLTSPVRHARSLFNSL